MKGFIAWQYKNVFDKYGRPRHYYLSLWVGRARESHGGGREEARIKVAGEAVDQQLGVGGEAVRPTIAASVPTEEGERAGLGEEAHTAEQVRLV